MTDADADTTETDDSDDEQNEKHWEVGVQAFRHVEVTASTEEEARQKAKEVADPGTVWTVNDTTKPFEYEP